MKTISTDLSDFHKMVVSVLKHTFHRSAPKELVYRGNENFDRGIFKRELEDKLDQQINECKHFKKIFLETLNIHATPKKKLLRAKHVTYINKKNEKLKFYKKQRNFCSKLYNKK